MASKKKKNGNGPIVGLLTLGAIGLVVLAAYVRFGGADRVPEESRRPMPAKKSSPANQKPTEEVKVTLVDPSGDGEDLKLNKSEVTVPAGEDPMLYSVNHFLKASKIVPDSAKAIGVQVKDHVALLDMTPSFNQTYGAFDEQTLLQGISASLSQFKNIDKVQFFVEGKPVETLGNVDLTQPIPIRTGENEPSPPAN